LTTLRGSILEDCIPSTSKLSSARGLSPKDVIDYVVPGLSVSCLRYATVGQKTHDQLLRVDEQTVSACFCQLESFISYDMLFFTTQSSYASVVLGIVILSVRRFVHLSVTCVLCDETKQNTGNIFIPHERKGKEEYLPVYSAFIQSHKVLRHGSHSFNCKLHHACLFLVSVHQMAHPLNVVVNI